MGGKMWREEKAKKSKERREEPLGTMSYQTSSKRSPPFWLLIGARKLVFIWHHLAPRGSSRRSLLFFVPYIFFRPFRPSLVPTICPWVSEDGSPWTQLLKANKGGKKRFLFSVQPRPQGAFPWLWRCPLHSQGKAPWGRGCTLL